MSIEKQKPCWVQGFLSNTHPKGHVLNTTKDMENLTIISGQSEKFVLIDKENDDYSATFWYCPFEKYNGDLFDETDLIDINLEFVHQVRESVSGWEYPIFTETKIYPGDDDFDSSLATKEALDVANEMIKQHQPKYV